MITYITIGITTYSGSDRAALGFVGIDQIAISCDEYSELDFTILDCNANGPFQPGMPVLLTIANDDGSDPLVVFSGDIVGPCSTAPAGTTGPWSFSYHCLDLKHRADYVTLRAWDGTSTAMYNLPPDDEDFDSSRVGKNVGYIVQEILQYLGTATALQGLGVGNYTIAGGIATLNALTIADLAFLTLVPQYGVRLEGESVLNVLDQFIRSEHPQYSMWVQADGTIRIGSPFNFTAFTLTIPGGTTTGDPVDWPEYSNNTNDCYTQYNIIGQDLSGFIGSVALGTLTPVNTNTDRTNWTLYDYLQPKGSNDQGNCSVTSSTSVTVSSDDITASWSAGYWEGNAGVIFLFNTAATDFALAERRLVTLSASMSPGGTADIEWDSSQPLDFGGYSRYFLVANNDPLAYVDRLFWITDPSTGNTGLNTAIGANLRNRDPNGIPWANDTESGLTFYPAARVQWSIHGDDATVANRFPFDLLSTNVTILRNTGQVLLSEPACLTAALQAGTADALFLGYPTTAIGGLWNDVQVAIPYSRGFLNAQSPLGSFSGTAYTKLGIARPKVVMLDSYVSTDQNAAMIALAAERLLTMNNITTEGTIFHHGIPGGFSPFGVGFGLYLVFGGLSPGPLDGVFLPVRTSVIRWPNDASDIHTCTFRFSNRKAPFAADSQFLRPGFTRDDSNNIIVGGGFGGIDGGTDWFHPGHPNRDTFARKAAAQPDFVGPPQGLRNPLPPRAERDRMDLMDRLWNEGHPDAPKQAGPPRSGPPAPDRAHDAAGPQAPKFSTAQNLPPIPSSTPNMPPPVAPPPDPGMTGGGP